MSSPLDKPTLDTSGGTQIGSGTGNRAGTSAIGRTTTDERARFQLSREMKILLGVLALGAAVGGWYVFSGVGTPAPGDVTSTVPPQTSTAPQTSTVPPRTNAVPPQTGPKATTPSETTAPLLPGITAGTGVTPGVAAGSVVVGDVSGGTGPVDVAQVPFLNPQGSSAPGAGTQGNPTQGNPVPNDTALAGINPADPVAAVPSSNPFQPLTVINTNLPPAAAQPSSAAPPGTQPGNTVPGTSGVSVAGAVPLPNVPIAGISSGGAALGGSPSSGAGTTSAGMPSGGAIPLPVVPIGGLPNPSAGSPGNGGAAATAGNSNTGNSGPGGAAPVARPMPAAGSITPGLAIPKLGGIPLGSISRGTTAPGNTSTQTDPAATAPQPGVISQYGSANAPAIPVAPVISALDQLVQSRSLVFNAVVLGPINTAIFKTDKGFVVVPTGQTLPDSTVTLGEVTATSATLTLGSDSKILELDKR